MYIVRQIKTFLQVANAVDRTDQEPKVYETLKPHTAITKSCSDMNDINRILRYLGASGFLNRKLTCHYLINKKVAFGKLKLNFCNLCLAGKFRLSML